MKIAFITQKIPYGKGEAFIIDELNEFQKKCHSIIIYPIRPDKEIFHFTAHSLKDFTIKNTLISFNQIKELIILSLRHCEKILFIFKIIYRSRNFKIFLKNLIILPKASKFVMLLKENKIDHIHAYWGTTTATIALVAHIITKIPYSITCFRWDITENNLLKYKYKYCKFIRFSDYQGMNEFMRIIGLIDSAKLLVIHSGISFNDSNILTNKSRIETKRRIFCFLLPAFFVEKKGHIYFLEASRILFDRGYDFYCWLIGEGPFENKIKIRINELKLESIIQIDKTLSIDKLYRIFYDKICNVVILPSIVTSDNHREGIPMTLIGALRYGIPVISTNTGGIPELINDKVGILINPNSSIELADAMEYMIINPKKLNEMGKNGKLLIEKEYEVSSVVSTLLNQMLL